MPDRTQSRLRLGKVGRRVVEGAFDGGDIASDGGVTLVRLVDERLGLTRDRCITSPMRRPEGCGAIRAWTASS